MTKIHFPIIVYKTIFEIPNENEDYIIDNFNFILLCGNCYIYRKKKNQEHLDTYEFLKESRNRLFYENKIMAQKGKLEAFNVKWGELKVIFDINDDNY